MLSTQQDYHIEAMNNLLAATKENLEALLNSLAIQDDFTQYPYSQLFLPPNVN